MHFHIRIRASFISSQIIGRWQLSNFKKNEKKLKNSYSLTPHFSDSETQGRTVREMIGVE